MEGHSRKKAPRVLEINRRGNGLTSSDANNGGRVTRCCNRLGCSTRLESQEINHIGKARKGKSSISSLSVSSTEEGVGSSAGKSNMTSNRRTLPRLVVKEQIAAFGTTVRRFSSPSSGAAKSSDLSGSSTISHKRGLKNFRCSTLSDVLPSGSASSSSAHRGTDFTKRRAILSNGEGSSSAKSTVSSSSRGSSSSQSSNMSCTGRPNSLLAMDQGRMLSLRNHDNKTNDGRITRTTATSVRTRNTTCGSTASQLLVHKTRMRATPQPVLSSPTPKRELVINEAAPSSSSNSNMNVLPSNHSPCLGQSRYNNEMPSRRFSRHHETNRSRAFRDLSINLDELRHVSMGGIAEVLFELERIEQDDELTYEQLLSLETNLLLGSIGFYDQHREMRLDIDNMSYEELLALGERMGTVSTALSEEALAQCLTRSLYEPASLIAGIENDDTKCSICQEEYCSGEEVGKLGCEHRYHVECIQQWLRIKNWCPICKVSASPASSD